MQRYKCASRVKCWFKLNCKYPKLKSMIISFRIKTKTPFEYKTEWAFFTYFRCAYSKLLFLSTAVEFWFDGKFDRKIGISLKWDKIFWWNKKHNHP